MSERLNSYKNLARRLVVQERMIRRRPLRGSGFENFTFLHGILRKSLKIIGLEKKGLENILNFRVVERDLILPKVGKTWHGKRILHLSDLHLDGIPGLLEKLIETLPKLAYDITFITGDFRFGKGGYHPAQLAPSLQLLKYIKPGLGIYGILGNHDFIEQVEPLEERGMKILLNESIDLGDNFHLVGVDDPHLYRCEDLREALRDIPDEATKVLLAHSPEIVKEAADRGIDYYLCGHTHGGQIGLPIIGRPFINTRCSRKFAYGEFQFKGMLGFTHHGTGASSVAARFNAPAEIVIHKIGC